MHFTLRAGVTIVKKSEQPIMSTQFKLMPMVSYKDRMRYNNSSTKKLNKQLVKMQIHRETNDDKYRECNVKNISTADIEKQEQCITCSSCKYYNKYTDHVGICDWCILHNICMGDDISMHYCSICKQDEDADQIDKIELDEYNYDD